ncbi:MAG: phenylalanine--tRNA ligase subunit beta [Reyranellaceae bacterium]
MKFTLGWLKQHLDTDADLERIASTMTMLGLEVEGIVDPASNLKPFTVAHVISAEQHPDADRLRVCKVDTGKEILQVVCGAPNARTGMKGVFAPVGTTIPGTGLLLKPSKIRGQDSNGMLCSARELQLGEDHDGIIDLPADAPIGAPVAEVLGVNDPVIEIKITPNRGDCLGVRGVARDLAAAGLGTLKPEPQASAAAAFKSPIAWKRDFSAETGNACPIVAGRYFRGLRNGPSPAWLQNRLKAIGLRPISALVDITNFFTFDLNRPLHVFDAAKIKGDLTMRLAQPGETVMALDGRTYELDGDMTVIADEQGVQAIGGIMGGELSGCSDQTTEMFLEAAYFDPIRTATTGRKLGIQSDARYRFERGIDPQSCVSGIEAATRLILELCGGEASDIVQAGEVPADDRVYELRLSRIPGLAGFDVDSGESRRILQALGFVISGEGPTWRVSPPSWRPDIIGEADLVEEVVRVHGYDSIPSVPMPRLAAVTAPARTAQQRRPGHARRALAVRGLVEAVTWSFMAGKDAALFAPVDDGMRLANPMSADLDVMRPTIVPNLIDAAARNIARGMRDVALFEVGPQYAGNRPEDQTTVAAGIRSGLAQPRHWTGGQRPVDAFDAKADIQAAVQALGMDPEQPQVDAKAAPGWYHPGRSGALRLGPQIIGWFGEIHPAILAHYRIEQPTVGFELFIERVPMPKQAKSGKTRPPLKLLPLQPIERDFAFLVAEDVAAEAVVKAAKAAERALISRVAVFDLYAGKGVEPGKKSLAISVTIQPVDKTLTEAEIEAIAGRIVASVAKATGASLRG